MTQRTQGGFKDTQKLGMPNILPRHREFVDKMLAQPERTRKEIYMEVYNRTKETSNTPIAVLLKRPEVAHYLEKAGNALSNKMKKDQEAVAEELVKVGFARITDIMEWDAEGQVIFNPSKNLSDAQIAGISSITCTQTEKTYNGETQVSRRFTVKMHDKLGALQTYLKMIGLDPNAGKPSVIQNVIVLPPEESLDNSLARVRVFDVATEDEGD